MSSSPDVAVQSMLDACQGKLQIAEAQVENLKTALVTARRIGTAIGIIMARELVTDDAAFNMLAKRSQHTNRKLRDVADQVVQTGSLE